MRFTELVCLSVILTVLASSLSGLFIQFFKMDRQVELLRKKSDSLIFISQSFYNTCRGKGFSSLDEWKQDCSLLWNLESIEWEYVGGVNSGLYRGKWKGPYGNGEVYCKGSLNENNR